jgi:hypothetical protein
VANFTLHRGDIWRQSLTLAFDTFITFTLCRMHADLPLLVLGARWCGTVSRYGLDGPGVESPWRRDFPHAYRPALWPTQFPVQCALALFVDGKAAGASSAEVKERVDPYLYFPSGPYWPVLGRTLRLAPGHLSRYSDSLRSGRSGNRIPGGGEIFHTSTHRPWGRRRLL